MTRRRLAVLILALMLWPAAARAQGDVLDWLGQLSGPGPFHNKGKGYDANIFCFPVRLNCWVNDGVDEIDDSGKSDAKLILRFGNTFATTGFQQVFQDDPTDKRDVSQKTASFVLMYRANRIVDVGGGVHFVWFSSDDTVKPFSFSRRGKFVRRLIHLDAEMIWYSDGFSAANFNNTTSKFSVSSEYQNRLSLGIDGVAAVRIITGR
jgi:hypothetical protein